MKYFLELTRDGRTIISEVDVTPEPRPGDKEGDHFDLVRKHLIRDGWTEVTFKTEGVTKRFWKEEA